MGVAVILWASYLLKKGSFYIINDPNGGFMWQQLYVGNSLYLSRVSDHRGAHLFKNKRKMLIFWYICHIWEFFSSLQISAFAMGASRAVLLTYADLKQIAYRQLTERVWKDLKVIWRYLIAQWLIVCWAFLSIHSTFDSQTYLKFDRSLEFLWFHYNFWSRSSILGLQSEYC